ncbi:MAG: hypothetical protein ACMZ63_03780 [Methylotenera sp.]|jgi:hypothetical protein
MRYYAVIFSFLLATYSSAFAGGIPNIPQIPAFLPTVDNVAATKPMPLDGTWLITSIGKKIRIESGRAYAVDGWLHLFTLKIQPGMVVIKNISPTSAGQYTGEDLPLLGKWDAKVQPNRNLAVNVAGTLGPVNYTLVPVQLDKPDWYAQEMAAAGLAATGGDQPPPGYQPSPPPGSTPIETPPTEPTPPVTPPSPVEDDEDEEVDEVEEEEEMPGDDDEYEDEYEDDGPEDDWSEEEEEEEVVDIEELKVPATKGDRYSCKGKGVYYSKVGGKKYCYTCPKDFTRTSPTRKMDHAKACVNRKGKNTYKPYATRVKNVDGCGKGQFKSKGFCMSCPAGYKRFYHVDMYNASYGTNDCVPES